MAAFNREELSRCSKAELLDYIEQQQDQLSRFETRFRGGGLHTQMLYLMGVGETHFHNRGLVLPPLRTCTCKS